MAYKILGAKGLTGNTGYSLDSIPSNLLKTNDMAIVHYKDESQDQIYFYSFIESTNNEEDSPNIIIPYDSINSNDYGTWELSNVYINQDGYDNIYDNIKEYLPAKTFTIEINDWNTSVEGLYYYNITHNLNELHPIISTWDMFTNRLINVNIVSIDENYIRVETTEMLNLKLRISK